MVASRHHRHQRRRECGLTKAAAPEAMALWCRRGAPVVCWATVLRRWTTPTEAAPRAGHAYVCMWTALAFSPRGLTCSSSNSNCWVVDSLKVVCHQSCGLGGGATVGTPPNRNASRPRATTRVLCRAVFCIRAHTAHRTPKSFSSAR